MHSIVYIWPFLAQASFGWLQLAAKECSHVAEVSLAVLDGVCKGFFPYLAKFGRAVGSFADAHLIEG